MGDEYNMIYAICVATLATLGATQAGYYYHSSYAVPPIAGMGCGLLVWETIIDERKKKHVAINAQGELQYYGSCACAVAACFLMDIIPNGGGAGLLVALVLNFATDALISTKVPMVVATSFDNAALTYLLGSRAYTNNIDGWKLYLYLWAPGAVYLAAMVIMQFPRPNKWAIQLEESPTNYYKGLVIGIMLYTAVIELAPHIVDMDDTDKRWTALALSCMFILAPMLLLFLKHFEKKNSTADKKEVKDKTYIPLKMIPKTNRSIQF